MNDYDVRTDSEQTQSEYITLAGERGKLDFDDGFRQNTLFGKNVRFQSVVP